MPNRMIYSIGVVLILLIEIAIAIGTKSGTFVRDNLGDLFVIILIYCFLRAAFGLAAPLASGLAIAAGFVAELLQYLHLAQVLGLEQGSLLYILIGNTPSSADLAMYLIGGVIALVIDRSIIMPLFMRPR